MVVISLTLPTRVIAPTESASPKIRSDRDSIRGFGRAGAESDKFGKDFAAGKDLEPLRYFLREGKRDFRIHLQGVTVNTINVGIGNYVSIFTSSGKDGEKWIHP